MQFATSSNSRRQRRGTLVIFSQVFVPDPASVGQHVADVAVEMARRGWRVRVFAANRGYDDPTQQYPARENFHGVEVRRLPFSSFGKRSLLTRMIGTASFMLQAFFRGLFADDLSAIFFSTSPPLAGLIATAIKCFRNVPILYWAMDLNPDQLIALGKLKETDPAARFLESANRMILRRSSLIIALDRFFADRLLKRLVKRDKLAVIPPWPHETVIESIAHETNPFRAKHQLGGKFVVMYSGNHSPSNPLDTLLRAADVLKNDPTITFAFIGGGIGKKAVEKFVRERQLTNCLLLPYQPLAELRYSLSAADVHVVTLGDDMVGIIHPCKIYGAMAVARPILFFGPRPSHVSDLLDKHEFGAHVAHGDEQTAVTAIEKLRAALRGSSNAMGLEAQRVLRETLTQDILCTALCDKAEETIGDFRLRQ